eukprot:9493663-Pyramimonas_sp.AAC.1
MLTNTPRASSPPFHRATLPPTPECPHGLRLMRAGRVPKITVREHTHSRVPPGPARHIHVPALQD